MARCGDALMGAELNFRDVLNVFKVSSMNWQKSPRSAWSISSSHVWHPHPPCCFVLLTNNGNRHNKAHWFILSNQTNMCLNVLHFISNQTQIYINNYVSASKIHTWYYEEFLIHVEYTNENSVSCSCIDYFSTASSRLKHFTWLILSTFV